MLQLNDLNKQALLCSTLPLVAVVSFPAAVTPSPPSYPTAVPYLPDAAVTAFEATGLKGAVDSPLVSESQVSQGQEADDDQQQMPQQIHIQQHLKLHFHPQGLRQNISQIVSWFPSTFLKFESSKVRLLLPTVIEIYRRNSNS